MIGHRPSSLPSDSLPPRSDCLYANDPTSACIASTSLAPQWFPRPIYNRRGTTKRGKDCHIIETTGSLILISPLFPRFFHCCACLIFAFCFFFSHNILLRQFPSNRAGCQVISLLDGDADECSLHYYRVTCIHWIRLKKKRQQQKYIPCCC